MKKNMILLCACLAIGTCCVSSSSSASEFEVKDGILGLGRNVIIRLSKDHCLPKPNTIDGNNHHRGVWTLRNIYGSCGEMKLLTANSAFRDVQKKVLTNACSDLVNKCNIQLALPGDLNSISGIYCSARDILPHLSNQEKSLLRPILGHLLFLEGYLRYEHELADRVATIHDVYAYLQYVQDNAIEVDGYTPAPRSWALEPDLIYPRFAAAYNASMLKIWANDCIDGKAAQDRAEKLELWYK